MYKSKYVIIEPKGKSQQETLGEGAYGVVYKARNGQTGDYVALKKIKVESENEGISSSALREITLLMQLDHENVVKLMDVEMQPDRLNLIFELVDSDLKKYMDKIDGYMNEDLIKSYTAQMLEGLAYCHSMGVMHRDLKPHNILVNRLGSLKIADFGLARTFLPNARNLTVEVVTRWYRAPELLMGHAHYDVAVDLWSIGCILAEMSNKKALFPGDSEIDQIHKIFQTLGSPSLAQWPDLSSMPYWRNSFPSWNYRTNWTAMLPRLSSDGVDLMKNLLVFNPAHRITAHAALSHKFVRCHRAPQYLEIVSPGGVAAGSRNNNQFLTPPAAVVNPLVNQVTMSSSSAHPHASHPFTQQTHQQAQQQAQQGVGVNVTPAVVTLEDATYISDIEAEEEDGVDEATMLDAPMDISFTESTTEEVAGVTGIAYGAAEYGEEQEGESSLPPHTMSHENSEVSLFEQKLAEKTKKQFAEKSPFKSISMQQSHARNTRSSSTVHEVTSEDAAVLDLDAAEEEEQDQEVVEECAMNLSMNEPVDPAEEAVVSGTSAADVSFEGNVNANDLSLTDSTLDMLINMSPAAAHQQEEEATTMISLDQSTLDVLVKLTPEERAANDATVSDPSVDFVDRMAPPHATTDSSFVAPAISELAAAIAASAAASFAEPNATSAHQKKGKKRRFNGETKSNIVVTKNDIAEFVGVMLEPSPTPAVSVSAAVAEQQGSMHDQELEQGQEVLVAAEIEDPAMVATVSKSKRSSKSKKTATPPAAFISEIATHIESTESGGFAVESVAEPVNPITTEAGVDILEQKMQKVAVKKASAEVTERKSARQASRKSKLAASDDIAVDTTVVVAPSGGALDLVEEAAAVYEATTSVASLAENTASAVEEVHEMIVELGVEEHIGAAAEEVQEVPVTHQSKSKKNAKKSSKWSKGSKCVVLSAITKAAPAMIASRYFESSDEEMEIELPEPSNVPETESAETNESIEVTEILVDPAVDTTSSSAGPSIAAVTTQQDQEEAVVVDEVHDVIVELGVEEHIGAAAEEVQDNKKNAKRSNKKSAAITKAAPAMIASRYFESSESAHNNVSASQSAGVFVVDRAVDTTSSSSEMPVLSDEVAEVVAGPSIAGVTTEQDQEEVGSKTKKIKKSNKKSSKKSKQSTVDADVVDATDADTAVVTAVGNSPKLDAVESAIESEDVVVDAVDAAPTEEVAVPAVEAQDEEQEQEQEQVETVKSCKSKKSVTKKASSGSIAKNVVTKVLGEDDDAVAMDTEPVAVSNTVEDVAVVSIKDIVLSDLSLEQLEAKKCELNKAICAAKKSSGLAGSLSTEVMVVRAEIKRRLKADTHKTSQATKASPAAVRHQETTTIPVSNAKKQKTAVADSFAAAEPASASNTEQVLAPTAATLTSTEYWGGGKGRSSDMSLLVYNSLHMGCVETEDVNGRALRKRKSLNEA